MEGPASTSPLVETMTGSTTKAAFNLIITSLNSVKSQIKSFEINRDFFFFLYLEPKAQ